MYCVHLLYDALPRLAPVVFAAAAVPAGLPPCASSIRCNAEMIVGRREAGSNSTCREGGRTLQYYDGGTDLPLRYTF